MTRMQPHCESWESAEAVFSFRIFRTVFSMRAHMSMPGFDLGLVVAHIFLIFKSFIRNLSKCGVHLYNTRKQAACMHMHSQFIAV